MPEPPQHDDLERSLLLTVAAVARRLGVAPATLRTWDRRYGLGPSEHAPGSHRRYRPADVRRLGAMRSLTLRGMPPGDAARAVLAGPAPEATTDVAVPETPRPRTESTAAPIPAAPDGAVGPDAADGPAGPAAADGRTATRSRRGGGKSLALPGADDRVRGLAAAAMALDQAAVLGALRATMRSAGAARTWLDLVRPVLVAIGDRWQASGNGVEIEHLLTAAAMTVFADVVAAPEPPHGRPVLLGAAPEETHDLPLHALAATLAEHGVGARMLGARVPAEALAAAVRRIGPCAVVVYSLMPSSADPDLLDGIPVTRPAVSIFAAGRGWSGIGLPKRVTPVDDLRTARRLVSAAAGRSAT